MQLCTEQEQLRLLPNECHRLNSADVGAGQTHLAFAALEPPRVAASLKKVNSRSLVINCLPVQMQSRTCLSIELRQVSASQFLEATQWPRHHIMHTYHGRHVVATRPGLPSIFRCHQTSVRYGVRRTSRPAPPCNDHLSMQSTHGHGLPGHMV